MTTVLRRIVEEEQGGMLLSVVAFLPVFLAIGAFVLDVGNAFEHRRHLQLQADAGALATGQEFTRCHTDPSGANAAIKQKAGEYAGGGGDDYNAQIGGTDAQGRVLAVLNGSSYEGPSGSLGEPCETGFIDVKLTEQDSPSFFDFLGLHDFHGHARLQLLRLQSSERLLPIAVEDPTPKAARAIFVDESNGQPLAEVPLKPNGSEGGLAIWDNSTEPVSVPITAEHVGVRIALGGSSSTNCTDTLVACYDGVDTTKGILHIQGWSGAGAVNQNPPDGPQDRPLVRSVSLRNGSCADPYFVSSATSCTIGVKAKVDFGGVPANVGAQLTASVAGVKYPMSYDSATETWSSATDIPIPPLAGPREVTLDWEETKGRIGDDVCKAGGGNKCKGSFGVQQRSLSAEHARSGPIALAEVSEGGVAWVNSLERCSAVLLSCSHSPVVKIGVRGTLELSDADGPPVRLRVTSGSQNQSLDCDPAISTLKDELAGGCAPLYERNEGAPCPGSPAALWASAQPWKCVAVQTGTSANQVAAGLNKRILGAEKPTACTSPNRWPDVRSGDPRIVFVIVTPFGAFSGSGSDTKPVVRLAAFYITGWNGQGGGFDNPCLGSGDEPPTDPAEIVGRFIKYVDTPNTGGASETPCDLDGIDVCAAVLVE